MKDLVRAIPSLRALGVDLPACECEIEVCCTNIPFVKNIFLFYFLVMHSDFQKILISF